MARCGGGGGRVSIMAAVGNDVTCALRQQKHGGSVLCKDGGCVEDARRRHWYGDDDNNGWDLPSPQAAWVMATDAAMLLFPPTDNKIDYDDKDGR
jgi:hypothetical protein